MTITKKKNYREGRTWPTYLLGGRLRTSSAVLIIAFLAVWWLYETYEPIPPHPTQIPATEVVPPGFIPDPEYTWAPRTDVQRNNPETTPTSTTPTTPTTSEEETPAPTSTVSPTTKPSSGGSTAPATGSSAVTSAPSSTSSAASLPPLTHPTALPSASTSATPTP